MTILLAVLAAAANATASILQRKAAGRVPDVKSLRPSLILQLLHYPVWFAGIGAVIAGFLLQAVALSGGTLVLVQPILVAELPITLVGSSLVFGSRLGRKEWTAVLAMSGGLAMALATAAPSAGRTPLSGVQWAIGIGASLVLIGVLAVVGRRGEGARRAAYFGVAAGSAFGLTAALMKSMTDAFAQGIAAGFTAWQLYLMVATGALAMFLLQNALQAGRLAASQPGLSIADPVVATIWGLALFGETARTGLFLLPEIIGIALIVSGVLLLTRSPLLSDEAGRHEQDDPALASAE